MGCTTKYYRQALQVLAAALTDYIKQEEFEKYKNSSCVEDLEECVRLQKETLAKEGREAEFYCDVGRVYQYVLDEEDNKGDVDGFNACSGGLYQFLKFVGVYGGPADT